MSNQSQDLIYEVDNEIGLITLNRPQARNALTFEMYSEIADLLQGAPTDGSVKAIIITGAGGKAFAAGTDISLFRDFQGAESGIAYETRGDANLLRMETCPIPVIAAMSGACTGGGAAVAAICDIRLASKDLRFGFPIARTLGNCLSAANYWRLVNLLGEARVTEMIFTSRLLGAEEALSVGLVSEVVEDNAAVRARAFHLAEQLKGHAPLTLRATKTLLHRLRHARPQVEDHDVIREVYGSKDFREGLEAFLGKRMPEWTGR